MVQPVINMAVANNEEEVKSAEDAFAKSIVFNIVLNDKTHIDISILLLGLP